jgi:hypothetical protein
VQPLLDAAPEWGGSTVTNSERLVESVYNLVDQQPNERARAEVARIALLAAQHRAAQLKQPPKERKDTNQ